MSRPEKNPYQIPDTTQTNCNTSRPVDAVVVNNGAVAPGHFTLPGHVTVREPVASCRNNNVNEVPGVAVGNVNVQLPVNVTSFIVATEGAGIVCAVPDADTVLIASVNDANVFKFAADKGVAVLGLSCHVIATAHRFRFVGNNAGDGYVVGLGNNTVGLITIGPPSWGSKKPPSQQPDGYRSEQTNYNSAQRQPGQ